MEKLEEIKGKINQLSIKLKRNQNLSQKIEKKDLELEQILNERNNLIDKLTKAENKINQLIQRIENYKT